MTKAFLHCAGAALALTLASCDQPTAPANDAAPESPGDASAVEKMTDEFLAAIEGKDFAKVKSYYAPDAVMVLPMDAPFKGLSAISAEYDEFAKDPAGKFDATNESTVVGSDMAYAQGTYSVTYTNSDTKKVENGQGYYLVVFRKQPDGTWKIVQDVSAPTPPTAPAAG